MTVSDQKHYSYTGLRRRLINLFDFPLSKVLDVGCSTGVNGSFMKNECRVNEVVGIEFDIDYAAVASKAIDRVYSVDLDNLSPSVFSESGFDGLLFGDVLEHTKNPENVLKFLAGKSVKNAQLVISVPNVQHWFVLWSLAVGRWPKNERGIFDRTHLRWFTRKSIFELANESSLKVVDYQRVFRLTEAPGRRVNRFSSVCKFLPAKNFFTFQHIAKLAKKA